MPGYQDRAPQQQGGEEPYYQTEVFAAPTKVRKDRYENVVDGYDVAAAVDAHLNRMRTLGRVPVLDVVMPTRQGNNACRLITTAPAPEVQQQVAEALHPIGEPLPLVDGSGASAPQGPPQL